MEQEIVKNCVQLKAKIVCEFLENVFSLNRRLFSKIHVRFFKEISQFVSLIWEKEYSSGNRGGNLKVLFSFFSVNFERRKKKNVQMKFLVKKGKWKWISYEISAKSENDNFLKSKKPWIFLDSKNFMNFKRIVDKCTVQPPPKNEIILNY